LPCTNPKAFASRTRVALALLVFAGVIFRGEVAILVATTSIYLMVVPLLSLQQLVRTGIVASSTSLLLSVPIDSYFHQSLVWPELAGFYYNAVEGRSSDWGVSPWHYYFSNALPRLLHPIPFLWALWNPTTATAARRLSIPSLAFVVVYSLQPHKEARFIFYVVPPLTAAAALGMNHIFQRRGKSALYAVASLVLGLSVAAQFVASCGILLLSSLNYPGGEALAHLRTLVAQDARAGGGAAMSSYVAAHADVLSCMTGVTLFESEAGGSMPASRPSRGPKGVPVVVDGSSSSSSSSSSNASRSAEARGPTLAIDRTEDRATLRDPKFWRQFDYVLMEDPAAVRGGEWDVVAVVRAYAGLEVLRPGQETQAPADSAAAAEEAEPTVGRAAAIAKVRDMVRAVSGGWWVGPRMEPKIRIMKRRKGARKSPQPSAVS
jgi:alpha-1,6-mannosyltransferase